MAMTFVPGRSAWAPIRRARQASPAIAWFSATFGDALATVAALLDERRGWLPKPAAQPGQTLVRSQGGPADQSDGGSGTPPAADMAPATGVVAPDPGTSSDSSTPPALDGQPAPGDARLKQPKIVIVHRQPEEPPLPHADAKRRRTFGHDPLEDRRAPKALRRAVDDLLGDLEDIRNDDRGEEGR